MDVNARNYRWSETRSKVCQMCDMAWKNSKMLTTFCNFMTFAEILQARRHGRERHIIRQRVDLLEEFTAQEFLKRFRLSKDCVASLLDELRQYLPTSIDRRGLRISPRMQLLATLRYVCNR
ncbi:hypothetical protein GWK47_048691 [Chionoecetes opilio]|uniref:Uncharacterized protein n=1 Tax=Chionoecetes opilio TaxID=41210 RepID=A0A8J4Y2R8_CHIOP|nr:hypothetical protein GWK47_048691 [Chionoecetes opilio]